MALGYRDVLPSIFVEVDRQLKERKKKEEDYVDTAEWVKHHNIPAEYMAELAGFVGYVDSPEVTLERLILWQLYYEIGLSYMSVGVLAVDVNGTVIHGRNMDTFLKFIARGKRMDAEDVAIETVFTRGGKPIFSSLGLIGQIGVATGMTVGGAEGNGSWSFQQSTRYASLPKSNLVAAKYGGLPNTFVGRSLMEGGLDYKQAVKKAMAVKLMAPMYLILAGSGPWQGAVLVMDRIPSTTKKAVMHRVQVLSPSIDRWFIVQTNGDFWTEGSDSRRPEGIKLMTSLGRDNVNAENILLTMRTTPLFNDMTVLSWLGVPATGKQMVYKAQQSLRLMGRSGLRPEAELQRLASLGRSTGR